MKKSSPQSEGPGVITIFIITAELPTFPLPQRTSVPMNVTQVLSVTPFLRDTCLGTGSTDFWLGLGSPVKLDSSTAKSTA